MKKLIPHGNAIIVFCLALGFAFAACSTTGLQRSENVQESMKTVDDDIKNIVVQIDAIENSLEQLTRPVQTDRMRAFDRFSDDVSKIKKMESDFAKNATRMERSGDAYFKAWEKDSQRYENPDIQRQSMERREQLGATYDKIEQNNEGVKEAFRAYVSDLDEIERFLSNDLTSEGIDSISPISNNVLNNGAQLRNELQSLQSAIEEARLQMRRN